MKIFVSHVRNSHAESAFHRRGFSRVEPKKEREDGERRRRKKEEGKAAGETHIDRKYSGRIKINSVPTGMSADGDTCINCIRTVDVRGKERDRKRGRENVPVWLVHMCAPSTVVLSRISFGLYSPT